MSPGGRASIRRHLGAAVKEASLAADRVIPRAAGITLLIYHRVGLGTSSLVDMPIADFDAQMEFLAANYRVIGLGEAVAELTNGTARQPVRPGVVLTFDDGTADFVDNTLPILAKHRLPATLYLATGFIDGAIPWFDGSPSMSRAGLKEVADSGVVEVGSHTHRHSLLDRLADHEIAEELDRSIDLIGEWCGVYPHDFAYPKAVPPSSVADREVRARFRSAALATPGSNGVGQDPFTLRRTPIQRSDSNRHVAAKASGGMRLESVLREQFNRLRYRGKTV